MRIAAVQMRAKLGNVEANLKSAERLASQAFGEGAEWVILPELFTSAMAFHPKMLGAAQPIEGEPAQMLKSLAARYEAVIGGSFLAIRSQDTFNTFVLAFPGGTAFFHDKDQPTMWENCYCCGGSDEGLFETSVGRIGTVLGWEFLRTRTVRRFLDRVDLVVGGSCWWNFPERRLPGFPRWLEDWLFEVLLETPARFARMLGVPVVHTAHAGDFEGRMPLFPGFPYRSSYLGETQIVDATGNILARMKQADGEGFVIADLHAPERKDPLELVPDRFWVPYLPSQIRLLWLYQNLHGRFYYHLKTRTKLQVHG
jgi:predicted amidohydrolase